MRQGGDCRQPGAAFDALYFIDTMNSAILIYGTNCYGADDGAGG